MWHMNDLGWGWWLLMSVGMLAFWSLVIYAVFWLARGAASSGPRAQERESPTEILKRRLAGGEISVEEYERLRRAMAGEGPPEPREPVAH